MVQLNKIDGIEPGKVFRINGLLPLRAKLYPVSVKRGVPEDFPVIYNVLAKHKRREELIAWLAEIRWRAANYAWPITARDLLDVTWLHRGEGTIDYQLALAVRKMLYDDTVKYQGQRIPKVTIVGPTVVGEVCQPSVIEFETPAFTLFIDRLRVGKHVAVMNRMDREHWYADQCRERIRRRFKRKTVKISGCEV